MKDEALFSPDPRIRWEAARQYTQAKGRALDQEIAETYPSWPKYWWGTANAWLVFVGPSPGNSGGNAIDWPKERWPTLGKPHPHFQTQWDRAGFWERMREWTIQAYKLAGIFPHDKEAALGLTLLANVLDTPAGDAGKITGLLPGAMPNVLNNLELVRPRLIVPMHKQVSKLLVEELRKRGARLTIGPKEILVPAKNQRFAHYKPKDWHLETKFGPLLVAEAPQHPSKRNFYDPQVLDNYLADKMRLCL